MLRILLLPRFIIGSIAYILLCLNLLMHFLIIALPAFVKKTIPNSALAKPISHLMVLIAKNWIFVNRLILYFTAAPTIQVEGLDCLPEKNSSVMVVSNHRSASDIVIKQFIFNRKLPMLKFFVKSQLRKTPFLGYVWDAMDMPFLKRFSKAHLAKHPEDKGKDFDCIVQACDKFKVSPVAVISYIEGTRITPEKHAEQGKEFNNLLKPRSGGLSCVLKSMKTQLSGIIDVTICYNPEEASFWDLYSGKVSKIVIDAKFIKIPEWVSSGDYQNDGAFRQRFQMWINEIWREKDKCYAGLLEKSVSTN